MDLTENTIPNIPNIKPGRGYSHDAFFTSKIYHGVTFLLNKED